MRRILAILSSSILASAMSAAPVFAVTGSGNTASNSSSFQHAVDCLALLFTNPKLHAQECGGPNFNPAPPPSAGGDGSACYTGEITAIGITGTPMKSDAATLVAYNCCYGELTAPQQQLNPLFDPLWGPADKTWLVTATAC